jgi:ABC-type transporter Mla subunit MlaD
VRTDTKALLAMAGITGLKVIDLLGGSLTAPEVAQNGVIPVGEGTLDKLAKQAELLADQSAQLMKRANQIVENLVVVTDPRRFAVINDVMAQASATAAAAKTTADNLAAASGTLKTMVGENRLALRESIASVQTSAQHVTAMLDGQVGQLVTNASEFVSELKGMVRNNEGQIRSAVFDLRQASRGFKELVRDVRQRPSRLLFSDTPGERKLP